MNVINKIKAFFSGLFSNVWFGIQTSYNASKFYFVMKLLILLSTTAIPLITIRLWREVLNGITERAADTVIISLGIYLFLQLAAYLLSQFNVYINSRYSDELHFHIEKIMMKKSSRMDLSFFDSAKMGDKVRHARSNFGAVTNMTWLVFDIISAFINVVAALIIVTGYKWWLGPLTLLLLIPYFIYNKKHNELLLKTERENLRDSRKRDYCSNVFFDTNYQFELKLNGAGSYFFRLYNDIWKKLHKKNTDIEIKHNIKSFFISLISTVSLALVLILSVFDYLSGKLGVGDLQYNLSMISRLRAQSELLMRDINQFIKKNEQLIELEEFLSIEPQTEKSGTLIPSSDPKIEFKDVSFKYPNSEQYVLKNCSFTIEPKEKIGLIGLNGSGKSTIIKLLFRFYDPDDGVILVDGIDMKEYDVYALRRIFGVLFQEYVTYCLPLREIIALSDFSERFNDEKLKRACEISGADEIIKDWEKGFDSVLGRYYADNGKDLSGGQWQLVSLARAYFKESEYMILDEPSAALDPISEDRIFEQLYRLGGNKSSVTISHRLSNTALADRILVIGEGHIIEEGSHRELLAQKGKYAHLFNLQASKYI